MPHVVALDLAILYSGVFGFNLLFCIKMLLAFR